MKQGKTNCFKCKYFYVTWEKDFPRGCKAMGFKSVEMPSDLVYRVSGTNYLKFEKKNRLVK